MIARAIRNGACDGVVFVNLAGHSLELGAQRGELCRLVLQRGDKLGQRADGLFLRRSKMLKAQRRRHHGIAGELQVGHRRAEPLADDVRVAPSDGGGAGCSAPAGGGGMFRATKANMRPMKVLGWPGRKRDPSAALEHSQHLLVDHCGTRREHVAELAEHDVERSVRIRQGLSIAFNELDSTPADAGILARALEQGRRSDRGRRPWRRAALS